MRLHGASTVPPNGTINLPDEKFERQVHAGIGWSGNQKEIKNGQPTFLFIPRPTTRTQRTVKSKHSRHLSLSVCFAKTGSACSHIQEPSPVAVAHEEFSAQARF